MKAALLISGYLRSFKINYPSLKAKILDRFKKIDIYIHITKDEENDDKYLNPVEELDYIQKTLAPVCLIREPNLKYSDCPKENAVYNLWAKYFKLNQIKKVNEKSFGVYDLVIKYRPDLNLVSDIDFDKAFEGEVQIPTNSLVDKTKLTKESDNYLCDTFAYGKSYCMDRYFGLYQHLKPLIEIHGPVSETLLFHYLESSIGYKTVDIDYSVILSQCNVIAVSGDSGSGKTTLSEILKQYFSNSFLLEGDRYHKWERQDSNWKNLTHLNPEANYLTKMSNDIFDLKVGKSVYQVDYDHKSGKFTGKEEISHSNNVIVCGLHSLYCKNHEICDLKIFMDTDEKLKTKWKLERDTSKRGKTQEEVLAQIGERKADYKQFIEPQRAGADIVVNFYENNGEVSLRLFVNKKYPLNDILNKFYESGIDFSLNTCKDKTFNEVIFKEYKDSNILDGFRVGNFYDYVVFFILSLNKK